MARSGFKNDDREAGKANASAGGGQNGGVGWVQDAAWDWQREGDGSGDDGSGGRRKQGAGQLLVHETHAPKRISHIQFGLLNAEVKEKETKRQDGGCR